jgi:hypothetical protein
MRLIKLKKKQRTKDRKIRTRTASTWGAVTSSTQADGRGYNHHARQYESTQPQPQNGQEPQRQPRRWLHPAAFGPYAPYPRRSRRRSCRLPRGNDTAHTRVPSQSRTIVQSNKVHLHICENSMHCQAYASKPPARACARKPSTSSVACTQTRTARTRHDPSLHRPPSWSSHTRWP